MSELSLNQISALELNSAKIGADLNDRLSNIDNNFAKIIQSDYLRGKSGSNFGTKQFYFSKNGLSPEIGATQNNFYNPVIKAGYPDHILMTNDYVVNRIKDAILTHHFNTTSSSNWPTTGYGGALASVTDKNGNIVNWYDNLEEVNSIVFIVEESNGKILVQSSLAYIFIDKRFTCITDANKNQYQNLVDLSCIIYYSINDVGSGSQGGTFYTVKSFPTIEYDATSSNFYWKIYGSNSGLIAQGPKGDSVSNALTFCTYSDDINTDEENNKYVTISKVLVTYTETEGSNQGQTVTTFMDIHEALSKNYINFDVVKDELNHIKLCAFCVPDAIDQSNGNQQIIAGTICYTGDITRSVNGDYIVRFNENLAFNHLFNQRNFFSTMLRNSHNGDLTNLINGYGALFIPMDSCGESGNEPTAAHVMIPGYHEHKEDCEHEAIEANVLNIMPIKDINDGNIRTQLADRNNPSILFSENINNILMADCPMNVYYDVQLINRPIRFKTSTVNIDNDKSYNIKYNSCDKKAQFDISYKSDGKKEVYVAGTPTNITPQLDIEYIWDSDDALTGLESDKIKIKPSLGLNGVALLLKHKDSLNHSVLDFIKDGVKNTSDDRGTSAGSHRILYSNDLTNVKNDYFHLIKTLGNTGADTSNENPLLGYNINTQYCNYNSVIPYCFDRDTTSTSIVLPQFEYKKVDISNGSTISYNNPTNNIYLYGFTYPRLFKNTTDISSECKKCDVISIYADEVIDSKSNKAYEATTTTSLNIYSNMNLVSDQYTYPNYVCPSFSIYRDYRTGYMLQTEKITYTNSTAVSYEYKKKAINAIKSHPLDYVNMTSTDKTAIGDTVKAPNLRSHEGVVYPHKLILTNSANINDRYEDGKNVGHVIDRNPTMPEQNFENYGVVIARIDAPTGSDDTTIKLNEQQLKNSDWKFNINFNSNKLIAPIINIRSNSIASPGLDYMRGRAWNNALEVAAYNLINTGLAINQAKHSLSYRFIYRFRDNDGKLYEGKTNKQKLSNSTTIQKIETGVCGNINSNFLTSDTNKKIKDNMPLVGHLCNAGVMSLAGYSITTADPTDINKERSYNGTGNSYSIDNQLPQLSQHIFNEFSNLGGALGNVYKYYSHDTCCTPIDAMYNLGMYEIPLNNGATYFGNDGYRTVTLPYYPGATTYSVTVNNSVLSEIINSIKNGTSEAYLIEETEVAQQSNARVVGGENADGGTAPGDEEEGAPDIPPEIIDPVPGTGTGQPSTGAGSNWGDKVPVGRLNNINDLEIISLEIIYNCEVSFDTLLDVVSGAIHRRSGGETWKTLRDTRLFVCDAIPHSKFIKHDIASQIKGSYTSIQGDGDQLGLSSFKLASGIGEYYSGYRSQIDDLNGKDKARNVIGAGYYYATMYDLDSYYNRAFMNPYYISDSGVKYNFSPLKTAMYKANGQYIYPKGSCRHKYNTTSDEIKVINNISTNHPPYFIGVGLIDCSNQVGIIDEYKGQKNKGIVYLCCGDDKAYDQTYDAGAYVYGQASDSTSGFHTFGFKNDIRDKNQNSVLSKLSPFVQKWMEVEGKNANDNNNNIIDFKEKRDIISLWYPKSTDIFNNPFMFNEPVSINMSQDPSATKYSYNVPSNYTVNPASINSVTDNPLSQNFNFDNIKLAFRKCNIKTDSKGYYNGHSTEYGELDNCRLSMLNITTDNEKYTSGVMAAEFINANSTTSNPSEAIKFTINETTNNNFKQNNVVSANICNDGVVWKDDSSNYVAIHMTGNVDDYQNVSINKEIPKGNSSAVIETVNLAGANGLPQTHMYISKNGSKSMYKIDFTKLLLAAGRLCETFGVSAGDNYVNLITDSDLDEVIAQQNN